MYTSARGNKCVNMCESGLLAVNSPSSIGIMDRLSKGNRDGLIHRASSVGRS